MEQEKVYTAFAGTRLIVSGDLKTMFLQTKAHLDQGESEPVLIFDDRTGRQIDFDFRGTPDEALARLEAHPAVGGRNTSAPPRTGPGRPKLGVVGREVTLLPRHWEWLEKQPGGISVTLRKLVDEARKKGQGKQFARQALEAAGNFMWAMAGNLPDFEEASRALYNKDPERLAELIADWPEDIRNHVEKLVGESVRLAEAAD